MSQGTGLRDWLMQRFTAVVLGAYTLFLFAFVFRHPDFNYNDWRALFSTFTMQISTILALVCIGIHAWIGMWTVLTDYVKPIAVRYPLQAIILITLFGYVFFGIMILWGD